MALSRLLAACTARLLEVDRYTVDRGATPCDTLGSITKNANGIMTSASQQPLLAAGDDAEAGFPPMDDGKWSGSANYPIGGLLCSYRFAYMHDSPPPNTRTTLDAKTRHD